MDETISCLINLEKDKEYYYEYNLVSLEDKEIKVNGVSFSTEK